MGHISAVSCNRQLPHMRHPNIGPFMHISTLASNRRPNGSFLKGKNAGCHLRAGLKRDIFSIVLKLNRTKREIN
jgi:hypothetical protein